MADLAAVQRSLEAVGQGHVLAGTSGLSPAQLDALLSQVGTIDLRAIPALVEMYVKNKPPGAVPTDIRPAPYYPKDPAAPVRRWDRARARAAGETLLRAGRVACFTVAGGQGTRLGFDGPKGCYPAGAVSRRSLFQFFAEAIAKIGGRYGRTPPWYIMTSPQNNSQTRTFFESHGYFGLPAGSVMFFTQGVMPSFELGSGRMLMSSPWEIATNPDGHGGAIRALVESGATGDMRRRGVEHISYFQVDNPIVPVADPVFLGLHASASDSSGEMSSKMLAKAYPEEKLGMFCVADGVLQIIEYSDLPMERQRERLPDGTLRFLAGSPAIHALSVEFVERVNSDPSFALPYHRAEKKVPCVDPRTGRAIEPATPNGVKLERFVFDAITLARASVVLEADRVEEFAPIKNAEGVDSPASSRDIQTLRAARWLERAGIEIPWKNLHAPDGSVTRVPDCTIDLSPRTAIEPEDLCRAGLPGRIERGASVVI